VPYQTFGPSAAATSAAVASYLSSLSTNSQLSHLTLVFGSVPYNSLLAQNSGCFIKANRQLWEPVMRTLRDAVEVSGWMPFGGTGGSLHGITWHMLWMRDMCVCATYQWTDH
jgi:hypothetical protein